MNIGLISNRMDKWKQKMINMTMRSPFVNLKENNSVIMINSEVINALKDFTIPGKIELSEYICDENIESILAIIKKEKDLKKRTGTEALYMTIGTVEWTDEEEFHQAPIWIMPVEVNRQGKLFEAVIQGRPFFNQAVKELLRIRYAIRMETSDIQYETIIDIYSLFEDLNGIFSKQMMELSVSQKCYLGILGTTQYTLWYDLINNIDKYVEAPLVSGIITGWKSEKNILSPSERESVLLPSVADQTQINTIISAINGESIVIQGPPGTGKSQTITNTIVNLINTDRSVLFVAEKQAALDVVYQRLSDMNVLMPCLYVRKSDLDNSEKERLLKELKTIISLGVPEETGIDKLREKQLKIESQIDDFARNMHSKRNCGYTAYELISDYLLLETEERLQFSDSFIESLTHDNIKLYVDLLEKLLSFSENGYEPRRNSLIDWGEYSYYPGMQSEIRPLIEQYSEHLKMLKQVYTMLFGEKAAETLGIDDARKLSKSVSYLRIINVIPKEFLENDQILENIEKWIQYKKYEIVYNKMSELYDLSVFDLPLKDLIRAWQKLKYEEGFISSEKKKLIRNQIQKRAKTYISENDIEVHLKILEGIKTTSKGITSIKESNWSLDEAQSVVKAIKTNGLTDTFIRQMNVLAQKGVDERTVLCLKESIKQIDEIRTLLESQYSYIPINNQSVHIQISAQEQWLRDLDYLRENEKYKKLRDECKKKGLCSAVDYYEKGHENVIEVFKKSIFEKLIQRMYTLQGEVSEFVGYNYERLLQEYIKINEEYKYASRNEMIRNYLLRIQRTKELPEYDFEWVNLRKIIENNGKKMSLRDIIDAIPKLFFIIKPCMISNPVSVINNIGINSTSIDTLILDEASQLETYKTVGLLARVHQAIVAGDSKQMPPTRFFEVDMSDEDDSLLEEDSESVMLDLIAAGLPQKTLLWHYRSRHESLIDFCNKEYYANELITFPSADCMKSKVCLKQVGGIYDRGHSMRNYDEAQACVAYIQEKINQGDSRSYGIITINKNQRDLIEQLIKCKAEQDTDFAKALRKNQENSEELFVRNLETVQGDERDVIIFSFGYGRDAEGCFPVNFGPLQRAGGWRRLNVALSRARDEMVVFSSLKSDQIPSSENMSLGVKSYKDFLVYCENEMVSQKKYSDCNSKDGFARHIVWLLNKSGYKCAVNVGNDKTNIDIAVYNPDNEGTFLLGIILNTEDFYRQNSFYDREIGQIQILTGLKWNLLRIWILDWQNDPHREEQKILKKLDELRKELIG